MHLYCSFLHGYQIMHYRVFCVNCDDSENNKSHIVVSCSSDVHIVQFQQLIPPNIWVVMIAGRIRQKIIRTALCCTVECTHTYEEFLHNSASLELGLICVCFFCIFFLNCGQFVCVVVSFCLFVCFGFFDYLLLVVITCATDCYDVLNGTLNPAHSLAHLFGASDLFMIFGAI